MTSLEKQFLAAYAIAPNATIFYTSVQQGRSYHPSLFSRFLSKFPETVDVLRSGNDAPRGGKLGDFVEVKFTKSFFDKYGSDIYDLLAAIERAKRAAEKDREDAEMSKDLIAEEAGRLTIDSTFTRDWNNTFLLSGETKSRAVNVAFTALLQRQNVVLKSNFWKVLKAFRTRFNF